MTAFTIAYLIVWLAMTAYCLRLVARQRRLLHLFDCEAVKRCC
jgi:CcmD family protein